MLTETHIIQLNIYFKNNIEASKEYHFGYNFPPEKIIEIGKIALRFRI